MRNLTTDVETDARVRERSAPVVVIDSGRLAVLARTGSRCRQRGSRGRQSRVFSRGTCHAVRGPVSFGIDVDLLRTLVLALLALPYAAEILWQLALLTRLMRALSPEQRAALPPHPRQPWLAVFGSVRFFLALFRLALRDAPSDGPVLAQAKGRARASAIREAVFGIAFWGTFALLWSQGWRPWS